MEKFFKHLHFLNNTSLCKYILITNTNSFQAEIFLLKNYGHHGQGLETKSVQKMFKMLRIKKVITFYKAIRKAC